MTKALFIFGWIWVIFSSHQLNLIEFSHPSNETEIIKSSVDQTAQCEYTLKEQKEAYKK